jgi:hypothetical protein
MKLAILGNSPLAFEAALRLHFHGAALTWYVSSEGFSAFDSGEHPPLCFSSKLGLQVLNDLNQNYSPDLFNWSQWVKGYEQPLVQFLKTHQEVREDEVVCVSKRFLRFDCQNVQFVCRRIYRKDETPDHHAIH